ncbi:unnamed protein product [Phytomonas sp. Hart1]|nr:unnamed protein product [Phytomonas sp. Hart1]|eukprot:CCW70805.1 unnamed protein product [Phytomonas sp. isolate Hart1]
MFIKYFACGALCGAFLGGLHCRELVAASSRELREYYASITDSTDQLKAIEELVGVKGISVRELIEFNSSSDSTKKAKRITYIFP